MSGNRKNLESEPKRKATREPKTTYLIGGQIGGYPYLISTTEAAKIIKCRPENLAGCVGCYNVGPMVIGAVTLWHLVMIKMVAELRAKNRENYQAERKIERLETKITSLKEKLNAARRLK